MIKLAAFYKGLQMHETSEFIIRLAQSAEVPKITEQDPMLAARVDDPRARGATDPNSAAAIKGLVGSGVFKAEFDIVNKLGPQVPQRFKGKNLDQIMREINSAIPFYQPLTHGSFDNYRKYVIPNLLRNPQIRSLVMDAKKFMELLRAYLGSPIIEEITKTTTDPAKKETIKKGIENILFQADNYSPINYAIGALGP